MQWTTGFRHINIRSFFYCSHFFNKIAQGRALSFAFFLLLLGTISGHSYDVLNVTSDVTINGGYGYDIFNISNGATLTLHYSGASSLDYGIGTVFTGNGRLRKTGSGTVLWGPHTTTFTLGPDAWIDIQEGVFVGSSHGNERWTYQGVDNTSGLNVAAGAQFWGVEGNIRVGRLTGAGKITSGYDSAGYQQFTFGADPYNTQWQATFSGTLANHENYAGRFVKEGGSTQYLTGNNTFTGGLVLKGGTVSIGNGGTTGSIVSNVEFSSGTLAFNRSNNFTYAGSFSHVPNYEGSGTIIKRGEGTLTLTGNNSQFTGVVSLQAGFIQFSNLNNLTKGPIWFDGGGLRWASGSTVDISSRIATGGDYIRLDTNGNNITLASSINAISMTKLGAGTLTFSGNNTFSQRAAILGGTAVLGHVNGLGTKEIYVETGATLNLQGHSIEVKRLTGTGVVTSTGTYQLTDHSIGNNNSLQGTANLIKSGSGSSILNGINTYSGGTQINSGTLFINSSEALGSGAVFVASGATLQSSNTILLNNITGPGTLFTNGGGYMYNATTHATIASILIGTGGLTKSGTGNLTLTGNNTYYGTTTINDGTLTVGSPTALNNSSNIVINAAGTLNLGSNNWELDMLSGTGYVTGSGQWTFDQGGTTIVGLKLGGTASLTKTGYGVLSLTNQNSFSGALQINSGSVAFEQASNLGTGQILLSGGMLTWSNGSTADISSRLVISGNNSTLNTGHGNVLFSSGFSGSGSFEKTGSGTLALGAANPFNGSITVKEGTLALLHNHALDGISVRLDNHATQLDIGNNIVNLSSISGTGQITGDSDGVLTYNSQNDFTLWNPIHASLSLIKSGSGHLTLASVSTNIGDTTILGGKLSVTSSAWATESTDAINIANNAILDVGASNLRLNRLTGEGTVVGSDYLTYQKDSAIATLSNQITGSASVIYSGSNLNLTVTGNNSYTGITTVNFGSTVLLGHQNAFSTGGVRVTHGATLDIGSQQFDLNRLFEDQSGGVLTSSNSGVFTFSGNGTKTVYHSIQGSASILKTGSGSLTLNGGNTFSGGVTVQSGNLLLDRDVSLGTGPLVIYAGATVGATLGTYNITQISGNGSFLGGSYIFSSASDYTSHISFHGDYLTKNGQGALTITGTHSYIGGINVNAGAFIVNGNITTGQTSLYGTTLKGNGSLRTLQLYTGSTLAPGNSIGTLSLNDTIFHGGTTYEWEITDAQGIAGVGYDTLIIGGSLIFSNDLSANNPLTIAITSLPSDNINALNFDQTQNYQFTLATIQNFITTTPFTSIAIDTTNFGYEFSGTWSTHLNTTGMKTWELHYTAAVIPEPRAFLLLALSSLLFLTKTHRRQR